MKKLCLTLIILIFADFACAQTTLTGGVKYSVESVRRELLSQPQIPVNQELLYAHIYDYKNKKDRITAAFSDSTYAVMYYDNPLYVWYYRHDGILLYIEKKDSADYPYKAYKYDVSGNLINMSMRVSQAETFIYNPDGKLIAHWINANGYNEQGKIIMTREYF
ncbi:MAG: hypothetical protein LBK53_06785 [Heliobacteriaceae bacterium]|jgi:hypothetical protein|nr:hypothetical protein [Heliobacteriaceae bacterium]